MSRLVILAAILHSATAYIQGHIDYQTNDCTGAPLKVDWTINTKGEPWGPGNCRNADSLRKCDANQAIVATNGANSTSIPCIDAESTNPDKVKGDFFPDGAKDKHYFIMTEYDNSIGSETCRAIEGKDNKQIGYWARTARMADGQCRSAGSGSGPNNESTRYLKISCQVDGSAYFQDWCDPTCSKCHFNSVVGYKSCGDIGSNNGEKVVAGGYCVLADKGGFPSEKPPKGYKPPPPTGEQVVKAGAAAVGRGTVIGMVVSVATVLVIFA